MLIGEATLKSATYDLRLTTLLGELRAAGCTVWLEGLRLRFDLPGGRDGSRQNYQRAAELDGLLAHYSDIVDRLPFPEPSRADKLMPPARRVGLFRFRRTRAARTAHD